MRNFREGPRSITWCLIIVATCALLFLFQKILWLVVPFMLALALYHLLSPLSKRLIVAGLSSSFVAAILSGAFLMVLGGTLLLVYPIVIANIGEWQHTMTRYLNGGSAAIEAGIASLQHEYAFLRKTDMSGMVRQNLVSFAEQFSGNNLGNILFTIAAWMPSLLLAPVITYFLLKDGAKLRKFVGSSVPNAYFEKTLYLLYALDRTSRLYFISMLKLALIDAIFLFGGLWLLGVQSPLALGLIAAILGWVPYIGPLLGCALAVIVTATDFPGNISLIYWVIGLFALLRFLDDFLFVPYIVGKSMHIHPLLTLLMFFIGEAIAGVAGLMLVIPILGMVMVIGETMEIIFLDTRLRARHAYANRLHKINASRDFEVHQI